MKPLPTIYRDKFGEENITIFTNGTSLFTTIRGVSFEGTEFGELIPTAQTDQFELCENALAGESYLRGCALSVSIPVRLMTPAGLRFAEIIAEYDLGLPESLRRELSWHSGQISITQPEFQITSHAQPECGFEEDLLSLMSQLPNGFSFEICFTCGLSDYSPYGIGYFGYMACFRHIPEKYREVLSKAGLFAIWDDQTKQVQETHYCPCYELRPKGRGYRG